MCCLSRKSWIKQNISWNEAGFPWDILKGTLLKTEQLCVIKLMRIPASMELLKAACRQMPSPRAALQRCAAEWWHPRRTKSPTVTAPFFLGSNCSSLSFLQVKPCYSYTSRSLSPLSLLTAPVPALLLLLSLKCFSAGALLVLGLRTPSLPDAHLSDVGSSLSPQLPAPSDSALASCRAVQGRLLLIFPLRTMKSCAW